MKTYLKLIKNIKTEDDFKDAVIIISEACSDYKLSWEDFLKLMEILRKVRVEKGFKWGASI